MIRKKVLDNGLTILTESLPHVRSVSLGVWLKSGSRHETARANGISHFIEHLVFKGTERKNAQEIALIIDSIGGQVDAFTSKEYTCFYTRVLDEHLDVAVDLLTDIVLSPRFAATDIEKERKVIFEEIRMVEDTPEELVYDLFSEHYWKGHPMGRPIQGTRKTVASLTPTHLIRHFRRSYQPGNMVISAAGNLDRGRFTRSMTEAFSRLEPGKANGRLRPPRPNPFFVRREKKELEQLHICLGLPARPTGSRDRFPLLVLNTILGGTMSSRLWQRVREESGLAYSVYSGVNAFADCGFLMIHAATNPSTGDRVVREVIQELVRLKTGTVEEQELRVAKDHLKGSLMLSLESSSSRMSNLARQEIYFGRQFDNARILRGIDRVTARQVRTLARELFVGDRCGLAVVGRLSRFRTKRSQIDF